MEPVRILAIDGGGIRGIIPAVVIAHISESLNRPVTRLFDAMAGTSTGGIIALGLAVGASRDEPKFSPSEVLDLYLEHGEEIFPPKTDPGLGKPSLLGRGDSWGAIGRLFSPSGGNKKFGGNARFQAGPLEDLLQRYFGESRLKDLTVPTLVTSFDMARMQPVVFRQGANEPDTDQLIWKVARATSAAPTYFLPLELDAGGQPKYLVDGGVWANNPAALAYTAFSEPARETVVVSIGTGHPRPEPPPTYSALITRPWPRVAVDMLQVSMRGSSAAAHVLMSQLSDSIRSLHYFRLDVELTGGAEMADVSSQNLASLRDAGTRLIEEQGSAIAELMDFLT